MLMSPPVAVPPAPPGLRTVVVVCVERLPPVPPLPWTVVMPEPANDELPPVPPAVGEAPPPPAAPPEPTTTVHVAGSAEARSNLRALPPCPPPPDDEPALAGVVVVPPPPPPAPMTSTSMATRLAGFVHVVPAVAVRYARTMG